jgi:hypothetical protein
MITWIYVLQFVFLFVLAGAVGLLAYLARVNDHE